MVKNPPVNAGDVRDGGLMNLIPGLGRSLGGGHGNPSLAWRIPWTEQPGRLQAMWSQGRPQPEVT